MTTLHLTLFREWFDAIARGEKTEEYRSLNDYWRRKLIGRQYNEIRFANGYGRHRPFLRVEFLGVQEGVWRGSPVFVISLGKILETGNYQPALELTTPAD